MIVFFFKQDICPSMKRQHFILFAKIPSSGIQDETVPSLRNNILFFKPFTVRKHWNLQIIHDRHGYFVNDNPNVKETYFSVRSYLVILMMGLLLALGPTLTLHVGDGQIHGAPLLLGIMVSTTTKSKPGGHILTAVDTVGASSSSKSSRGDHHPLGSFPSSSLFWWSTIWFCELLMLGWSKPLWEMLKSS